MDCCEHEVNSMAFLSFPKQIMKQNRSNSGQFPSSFQQPHAVHLTTFLWRNKNASMQPSLLLCLFTGLTSLSPPHPPWFSCLPILSIFIALPFVSSCFCSIQTLAHLSWRKSEGPNSLHGITDWETPPRLSSPTFPEVAASQQKGLEVITNPNQGASEEQAQWVHRTHRIHVQAWQCHLHTKVTFIDSLFHTQSGPSYGNPLECIKMSCS